MFEFYEEIFKLKTLLRKGWLDRKVCDNVTKRVESDAEHTFSMALLALYIIKHKQLKLDESKVLKMILYHELCEIDTGDITPFDNVSKEQKYLEELKAVERISKNYNMPEILEIWKEFEEEKTQEAKFVKQMDKLDAVMQSKIYSNETNNNYLFNEFYNFSKEKIKEYSDLLNN